MHDSSGPAQRQVVATCSPLAQEQLALRPLAVTDVRLTGGPWARWQQANRAATIPHGLHWLEKDGVIDNFRRLWGESDAPRKGWVFCDSDLYKTLEAIGWDLAHGAHAPWDEAVTDAVGLLTKTQEGDGYLNTFVQAGLAGRWADLPRGHELYVGGHLIQAGIAHARVTGDERLLDIGRAFADLLVTEFGRDGRLTGTDGHPEIETALVELYRYTGVRAYLDLAEHLLDVRGHGLLGNGLFGPAYFQDDVPVRSRTEIVGHSVRALYLLAGVVDVYLETGEAALLEAAEAQWRSMVAGKTYLTGAVGSRFEGEAFGDAYELPPDLVYGETCAAIASVMVSWRLLLATGDGKYADLIERILHNAFAASTSADRTAFFYVNPMQRRKARPAPARGTKPLRTDAPGTRADWFDVACCPPNIMRTVASLTGYVATVDDGGVQLHQYLPATVAWDAGAVVRVQTEYPRTGTVTVVVDEAPGGSWALSLRVPSWARGGATVTVAGGETTAAAPDARGYHVVTRDWAAGDTVVLELPVEPRLTVPHPGVDAVRGCVAIERGPVVYCLEKPADAAAALPGELVDLTTVAIDPGSELVVVPAPQLGEDVLSIQVDGVEGADPAWDGAGWATLDEAPGPAGRPVTLTAIPYAVWANRGPSELRVWVPLAF
nr:beta-L-arabinofuranosidase domain-containing protein [Jiangella mangrovi]